MLRSLAAICAAVALAAPAGAAAATYDVSNTADTPVGQACAGTTGCSLREAITSANALGGADTIAVAAGTYVLANGQLETDDEVTIEGAGADITGIDAALASRALFANATTTVRDLTIRRGQVGDDGGTVDALGGGILGAGALMLDGVALVNNSAVGTNTAYGGAIFTTGSLVIENSTISRNGVSGGATGGGVAGGAVFADNSIVHIVDSTLSDNAATASAGATANAGAVRVNTDDLQISGSLFTGNSATSPTSSATAGAISTGYGVTASITDSTVQGNSVDGAGSAGGALFLGGPAAFTITGSTFADNEAIARGASELAQGGAIGVSPYSGGSLRLENATLMDNRATAYGTSGAIGGAIYASLGATISASTLTANTSEVLEGGGIAAGGAISGDFFTASTIALHGSILSGNTQATGDDCAYSTIASTGGNVVNAGSAAPSCPYADSGSADVLTASPGVGTLGDHDGPTPTALLLPTSPALDLYDADCPAADQRWVARPQGSACDAGAVEMRPALFTADPADLDFGSALVGTTTPAQLAALTNRGDLPGPPTLALDPAPAPFTMNGCDAVVEPGDTCDVALAFAPTEAGARAADLVVDGAPLVLLTGVGTVPAPATTTAVPACTDVSARTPTGTPTSVALRCSAPVWSWEIVGPPAHGTIGPIGADGTIAYTPEAGFTGVDAFRYRAVGPAGPSGPATVNVVVGDLAAAATESSTSPGGGGDSATGCRARSVTLRLNRTGARLVRARVTVDGVPAAVSHTGRRWTATFELRGRPGKRVTVAISARRADGKLVRSTRTLTVC